MYRFAIVIGTRPEAIKLRPLIVTVQPHARCILLCTGQHSAAVQKILAGLPQNDIRVLTMPKGGIHKRFMHSFRQVRSELLQHKPGWVLVHGDTLSALAGAHAAKSAGICLAHVEAGLRSSDPYSPWPEEPIRRRIAQLADRHYAPSPTAEQHLLHEGIPATAIQMTGNTLMDVISGQIRAPMEANTLLVTIHRRENWQDRGQAILNGLMTAARRGTRITYILPPNPVLRNRVLHHAGPESGLTFCPPLDHKAFLTRLARTQLVLTDSGGVQEEAAALGVPALIVRDATERPETTEAGLAKLIGWQAETVAYAIQDALTRSWPQRTYRYGDGQASFRIAMDLLEQTGTKEAAFGLESYRSNQLTDLSKPQVIN